MIHSESNMDKKYLKAGESWWQNSKSKKKPRHESRKILLWLKMISVKISRNYLEWLLTELWSTGRYASYSKCTRQKPKDRISTKKTETFDLKIQKQISPIYLVHSTNY